MVAELEYFERKESALEVYCAKPGQHDDYVMAFIWAMFCLNEKIVENYFVVERYMEAQNGHRMPLLVRSAASRYFTGAEDDAVDRKVQKMDRMFKTLIGEGIPGSKEQHERDHEEYKKHKLDVEEMYAVAMRAEGEDYPEGETCGSWN